MPTPPAAVNGEYGKAVRRVEDPALITGMGTYTDDVEAAGALHGAFVRSEVAHGRLAGVETSAAAQAPGVVAVYTAADLGLSPMPPGMMAPGDMLRPILAEGVVRFQGEPIALVVAETREQAVDAAELVEVDIEPLEVLVDPERALDDGAPTLFPDHGGNLAFEAESKDTDVLGDADVVVASRFVNQRVAAVPMEPSAALAAPDPETGGVRVWAPIQAPHAARDVMATCIGLEKDEVRVTVPDVGGGFGARIPAYPEQIAVAAAALRLGRPVRYVESRWETMIAMQHGRAQVQHVEIGARRDGTLVGIKVRVVADCGAYPGDAVLMPYLTGQMASGVYRIPRVDFGYRCVVTNTTPIGAYRGAGRPEATALVERAMDQLAAALEMDPAELRRRNFIPPDDFPHQTVAGARYDSGEYERALDLVLEAAGYEQLRAEQAQRRQRGDTRQLGIGLATYVELTGLGVEMGACTVNEDGTVTVKTGTSPQGQGHETTWAQLVSWTLGVPMSDVRVLHSDTAHVPRGMGTMGSRTLQVGGSAMVNATREVLGKARELAAHMLEASADDIQVVPGAGLGVAGTPSAVLSWAQLASAASDPSRLPDGMEPGLDAENDFTTPDSSYPFGAHVAVVEVDVETGLAKVVRHVTVDDSGLIANPMLAEGQIHGGIAQGVAQALYEEIAYDEDGNCVTGSMTSYALPTAAELPLFETDRTETPSPLNPLGAKGIGESGAIGATPAVWNAVVDALSHLGVQNVDMPATPQRVWRAIEAASAASAAV
ncbi:MAG: aerobic carbon-monoxide dehydrogenase large subunit [Solirubrobacteraceae bacterium]|jgi:carbon-monoxide dehydrogenase large subunit|nr:aerobic carbon-monoxide dehydrogenase large subunit [Solirubrobacteraceae bacterium]